MRDSIFKRIMFSLVSISILVPVACYADKDLSETVRRLYDEANKNKKYTLEYFTEIPPRTNRAEGIESRLMLASELYGKSFFTTDEGELARQMLLDYSNGNDRAFAKIMPILDSAVKKGDVHAMAWQGILKLLDFNTGQYRETYGKSKKLLMQAAELGDPYALFIVGLFHYQGVNDFTKDFDIALEYFKKSSERGGHWADLAMGNYYYFGNKDFKIEKDLKKALEFYRSSKSKGNLAAILALAVYENDLSFGSEKSLQYGRELCLTKTAFGAKGCGLWASSVLTQLVKDRFKSQESINEFKQIIKLGLRQDRINKDLLALRSFAYSRYFDEFDVTKEQAAFALINGCSGSDAGRVILNYTVSRSCEKLGLELMLPSKFINDVKVPKHTAIKAFRISYQHGHDLALLLIAEILSKHWGTIAIDKNLAFLLIRFLAEERNLPLGQFALGEYYEKDPKYKNIDKAKHWYSKAAGGGNNRAMESYSSMFLKPQWLDYEKCYIWSRLAELRGFSTAVLYKQCSNKVAQKRLKELDVLVNKKNKIVPKEFRH